MFKNFNNQNSSYYNLKKMKNIFFLLKKNYLIYFINLIKLNNKKIYYLFYLFFLQNKDYMYIKIIKNN